MRFNKLARLSLLPLLLSQTTSFPIPGEKLFEEAISALGKVLPVMIALTLLVILMAVPILAFKQLAGRLTGKD